MLVAIFGLTPTVVAVLAAVCSPRLGICALHGQLFYFAGLLLYSVIPLGPNVLWAVPVAACLLFIIGSLLACFIVREDLRPNSERSCKLLTVAIIVLNFCFFLLLLHSVLNIICFRLDQSALTPAVLLLKRIAKIGSGILLAWLVLVYIFKRRRLALSAIYAELGLLFSTYIVLLQGAGGLSWPMPLKMQQAMQLNSKMYYYTIAADADFAQALYFVPPVLALLCGFAGCFLLKPACKIDSTRQKNHGENNCEQSANRARSRQAGKTRVSKL